MVTALRCASKPSAFARVITVGAKAFKPDGDKGLHRHTLTKIRKPEAGIGASKAVSRQHMIGARGVIADGFWRPFA